MADDSTAGAVKTKNPSPLVYDKEKNKECKFEEVTTNDEKNKDRDCRKTVIYVDPEGYVCNANIKKNKIDALGKHGSMGVINAIVLHRTAYSDTAKKAFNGFATGTGSQFIIDKDGTIYQTASLFLYGDHIGLIRSKCYMEKTGTPEEIKEIYNLEKKKQYRYIHDSEIFCKTYPNRYPYNGDCVGIEVVSLNLGGHYKWEVATDRQLESINRLVDIIMNIYELSTDDIYEHDKISRKTMGEGSNLYTAKDYKNSEKSLKARGVKYI
ncbi:peptidoglycan recognition protein family protein [Salmonella enterica subsp. enterica]